MSNRGAASARQLLGREREREEIERVLGSVRNGLSGALVLRGEPGIGKTALLEYAVGLAKDMRVLRLVGIESEMELGYAALHQLLLPLLGEIEVLPVRQRRALGTAFGLEGEAAVDRMMVGLAALTLLSTFATRRPVLCVIDDAQWIDRESADVLAFVARRLYADRVAMVIAVRDPFAGHAAFDGIVEIRLDGLAEPEANQLLAAVAAGPVLDQVGSRVIAETRGNPLALEELGPLLTAGQLAGDTPMPEPIPVGSRLEARFSLQVRGLPKDTQTLLLAAAADPTGDPALLWRVGRALGFGRDAAAAAEAADLLMLGPPVTFRHPLVRSAVYYGALDPERRRVHQALAEATDADRDADRRAWHRSAAAAGHDEEVAADLELAAGRARARGGCAAAAAFLTRAAQLSLDPASRAVRLLAAADEEIAAGAPLRTQTLLDQALPDLQGPLDQAHAKALQGGLLVWQRGRAAAPSLLLEAAQAFWDHDVGAGREVLLEALLAATYVGRFAVGTDLIDVADAALRMPGVTEPTCGDLLLDGLAAWITGSYARAEPQLRRAITLLQSDPVAGQELRWVNFGCFAACALGDNLSLSVLARMVTSLADERGAWLSLREGLHCVVLGELIGGDLSDASAHAAEAKEIESAFGYPPEDITLALTLAWRGDEAELRAVADATRRDAPTNSRGWSLVIADYSLALLELSLGNYEAAWASWPADWEWDLYLAMFVAADGVEAAVRAGRDAEASSIVERYGRRVQTAQTPVPRGLLARAQALIGGAGDAEALYRESIELLDAATAYGEAARSRLVYGEWLRRANRRRDARDQLRTAHQMFEAVGARAFCERARVELEATGERARPRRDESRTNLTPQEAQVARLAAGGATDAEIASRLFISPNTVDYHLRKVYRKLGITSRRRLAGALASGA